MNEIWKDIKDFEGIYEVSNLGRVRTAKNKTTNSSLHDKRRWRQRVLRQKTDKKGYKRVNLWKNKTAKTFQVHRLVAIAFLEKMNGKECVNHIDGNPSNNYLDNLEWCNYTENLEHAYKNRLNKTPDPIVLVNLNTQEAYYFSSKVRASKFLGRNSGFVSNILKKGINEIDEYEIYIQSGQSNELSV